MIGTENTSNTPAVARLVRHAEGLVRAGRRPTVDVLVAECGGSRTTAQAALQSFWSDALPHLLAARVIEDADLPMPVLASVRRLWGEAQAIAGEAAQAAVQADRDAARLATETAAARVAEAVAQGDEARREAANVSIRLIAAEAAAAEAQSVAAAQITALTTARDAANAALSRVNAELSAAQATTEQMGARLTEAAATIAAMARAASEREQAWRGEITTLRADHQRVIGELAHTTAQHVSSLCTAHAGAVDEMRAAHLHAEQRLMVELDAARTQANQASKHLGALKARHAQAVDRLAVLERKQRVAHRLPVDNPDRSRG